MEPFNGFPAGLDLLEELPSWSKQRYTENRAAVAEWVVEPARALVEALGCELRSRVDPELVWQTKVGGSISPLHRDLRFAKDRSSLYKDHLVLTWFGGPDKRRSPTLWLRLRGHDAGFASGIGFTREIRDRWRAAVASERGAVLADALTTLISERDAEVAGDELARVPKPYTADHPRRDLLRHKSFQVRWLRPLGPEVRHGAFVDWCAAELAAAAPTHRWLVEELS